MKTLLKRIAFKVRVTLHGIKPNVVESRFQKNWALLTREHEREVESVLRAVYFKSSNFLNHPEDYLETDVGKEDLEDHLNRRLHTIRTQAVPWINSVKEIANARVLEVGCGTGASTVAFCEQGAEVTALDIDGASIRVAKRRCDSHQLKCEFVENDLCTHAASSPSLKYDIITFMAVLEHMTPAERNSSLQAANSMLHDDGIVVIYETPNRLWYQDRHTTRVNFYNWLPEELAIAYSRYVKRSGFSGSLADAHDKAKRLWRWGRGISFHEFCIAYECEKPDLPVVSSMDHYIRNRTNLHRLPQFKVSLAYERFLCEVEPDLWEGFATEYLNIILRKVPGI